MTIINTPYTEKEQKKQDLMYASAIVLEPLCTLALTIFIALVFMNIVVKK